MDNWLTTIVTFLLAVECVQATQVRLVGGSNMYGTVEVFHNGWGTICDDSFGNTDATVICRMLGFNGPSTAYSQAHFGAGSGPILLDELGCTGQETDISSCSSAGWGSSDCSHSEDAGVACSHGILRLVGGHGNHEGTVEVNGGTLCVDRFTDADAKVICRELGFISGKAVKGGQYGNIYGGAIEHDYLGCHGNETHLDQCPQFNGLGHIRTCNSGKTAGVFCDHTPVRLVGGSLPSEGRLEVQHAGAWGTVCDVNFGTQEANVVCRMLGFNTSSTAVSTGGNYGAANGPVWLSSLNCTGTEVDFTQCQHDSWDNNTCSHKQDVTVKCQPTEVRLSGGPGPWEGTLEVKLNSASWQYICDDNFSHNETKVICHMLGYDVSEEWDVLYKSEGFTHTSQHVSGTFRCRGDENDITHCVFQQAASCTAGVVGIRCSGIRVRLVDGPGLHAGRVELFHEGRWGTVCDRNFDDLDATVICRMVTYFPLDTYVTGIAVPANYFGYGNGPVHLANVACSGNETDVTRCSGDWSGGVNCDHTHDAGVYCSSGRNLWLEGNISTSQGTVLSFFNGGWNAYCDADWNETDLQVVCKELGFWNAKPMFISNRLQRSVNTYDIHPYCQGNEGLLEMCSHSPNRRSCSSSNVVSVDCNPVAAGSNQIRLVDGPGPWKGRLEVFYGSHWSSFCTVSWNQNLTDLVCRNLYFPQTNASWYNANKGLTAINFRSLECEGWESNVGQCKVNTTVTDCLLSHATVGIDCSSGITVTLGAAGQVSGQVHVHSPQSTVPLALCESGLNAGAAKTVCTMVGYTDTSPIVTGVTSNDSVMYTVVGCDGWEGHISQCMTSNDPFGNCSKKAVVNCFNCTREFNSASGITTSPNFPAYYPPDSDCLIIIKPPTSEPYKLQFHDLTLAGDGDFVEVKESPQGTQLGYFESTANVPLLVSDKGFYIRLKTNSAGEARGFNVSWSKLDIQDTLDLECRPDGWNVAVNLTVLRHLYPDTGVSQIKLTEQYCTGTVDGDLVVFTQSYSQCSTQSKTNADNVVYTNAIVYPESNNPFPLIVHGYRWKVEVECDVNRTDTLVNNFHPNQTINHQVPHVTSSGHYSSQVKFFSDGTFYTEIKGNPLTLRTGDDVYVSVTMDSSDIHVKMRLDTCYTTPYHLTYPSLTYPLIQNGCVVDSYTHILSQGTHETRFVFNAFEFPVSRDNVYIFCNATYCNTSDTSPLCTQTCAQNGGPPIIGRSLQLQGAYGQKRQDVA